MSTDSPQYRRGACYIRESTEDQDKGFSPENQRKRIKEYAADHNIEIVAYYKDLISGRRAENREDFQQMITDAIQGKFDVVLVFHTSRFARSVKDARKYKDMLRSKHGIDVISVSQQFGDWNDPNSFLNEGINELFDEHQSRQISFWVRSNLMEKRMQGKKIGNPPFGYYKKVIGHDPERDRQIYESQWRIDEEKAKWVRKAFEWYASGTHSFADIAVKFNEAGIVTNYGNPFTYSSVKEMIKNKAYAGYTTSPRRNLPEIANTHEAIISEELYEQAQAMRTKRKSGTGRPTKQHRFYLLQGLLYCEHCRKRENKEAERHHDAAAPKMYCQTKMLKDGKENKRYICKFRKEDRSCKRSTVTCEVIDAQVVDFMSTFSLPDDVIEMTIDKLKAKLDSRKKEQSKAPAKKSVASKIKKLESERERLNFQFLKMGELSEDEYEDKLKSIKAQISALQAEQTDANTPAPQARWTIEDHIAATEQFLRDFPAFFGRLDAQERRAWIQMCIKRIWVKNKKVVAIEPHDDFKPLFQHFKEYSDGLKDRGRDPSATPK